MAARNVLYQYMVLMHPTDEQTEKGEIPKEILSGSLFATSPKIAEMRLMTKIPAEYHIGIEKNQIEVLLRPF